MTSPLRILATKVAVMICGAFLAGAPPVGGAWIDAASAAAAELHGAGSTFAAPLYDAWIGAFEKDHPDILDPL